MPLFPLPCLAPAMAREGSGQVLGLREVVLYVPCCVWQLMTLSAAAPPPHLKHLRGSSYASMSHKVLAPCTHAGSLQAHTEPPEDSWPNSSKALVGRFSKLRGFFFLFWAPLFLLDFSLVLLLVSFPFLPFFHLFSFSYFHCSSFSTNFIFNTFSLVFDPHSLRQGQPDGLAHCLILW